ncbi:Alpha-ketoglutarate-dependent sulfonate dioxygenase [Penicillium cosmopolitanum]|uniref:Alpha-ketoglutarate-dependent sulfonate dioxygenase n=1 Tax=Penicillium cosmopolitanum TaxID=1131564 RepID=A0A9W9W7W5_9EURO|nr:Alpha-ketoglutarate-dependent sulfonate dioxygenase [Penicillium cosmopolitanum]KAJ5407949.1 Alpha-ketoglutarate-dependent sulfonate dioxygenase [Penicillium cosmopolitanum]
MSNTGAPLSLGPPVNRKPMTEVPESELNGTEDFPPAQFPNYLPIWEIPPNKHAPLEPFDHVEHGKDADPTFPDLLPQDSKLTHLTASIGAEISGVQLSQLNDKAKDQLALLAAQKKVLVFHDQDFAKIPISEAVDFAGYFGRLMHHPHSGYPAGHPEIHIVHRRAGNTISQDHFRSHTHSLAWHCDNTYERQPPGTTFLYALEVPEEGGDTIFVNTAAAYRRLSPAFQQRLHGLTALHTAHDQTAKALNSGGYVRREPITSIHPVVRTHPVTGEKCLFVNPQFTRYIVELKKEESDYLLKYLYDHLAYSQDMQCRVRWKAGDVVVWDNRLTNHSALMDWEDGRRRHIARITPEAEKPFE